MGILSTGNLLFFIAILIANIIQGLTGFAGSLLAMPPAINLQGLVTAKVAVNTFGLISSSILFVQNMKKIDKKEALKIIVLMGAGLVTGIWLTGIFTSDILLKIYASFIILVALKEMFYKGKLDFNNIALLIIVFVAGIFQGLFVSGGPLLIIYVSKKFQNSDEMRGTLGLIWIMMNGSLMVSQIMQGQFTPHNIMITLVGIPAVFIGVAIGSRLVKKLDREKFLKVVYVLLVISALTLLK